MAVTAPAVDVSVTYKQQSGAVTHGHPDRREGHVHEQRQRSSCSDTWALTADDRNHRFRPGRITYGYPLRSRAARPAAPAASASGQTGIADGVRRLQRRREQHLQADARHRSRTRSAATTARDDLTILCSSTASAAMLMRRSRSRASPTAADERGFTLVELLATMVAGIVVLLALCTIMDVTLRQTTTLVLARRRDRIARVRSSSRSRTSSTPRASPTRRRRSRSAATRTR